MPRKRFDAPIPQTTMNISLASYEFIEHRRRRGEPKYAVLDSLIEEYNLFKQEICKLQNENEELRLVVDDLKDSLNISRAKYDRLVVDSQGQESIAHTCMNS